EIVAQIAYLEATPDGHLRHPSYLGLREDKPAKAVKTGSSTVSLADRKKGKTRVQSAAVKTARKVAPKPVAKAAKKSGPIKLGSLRLTSPDKLLWADAGVTKLDLARYYHDMAKHILPHVKDRPLSLVRCPEGYE